MIPPVSKVNSQFPISNSQSRPNDSMNNENSLKTAKLQIENSKVPKWKIYVLALIAFFLLVFAGYGLTLVYKNFKLIRSDDPAAVVAALSKVTDLPTGETPTVSTLTDLESVKDQPFFRDAELGDKVIVYNGAGKAYIYRPTTGKLIGIAPLSQ